MEKAGQGMRDGERIADHIRSYGAFQPAVGALSSTASCPSSSSSSFSISSSFSSFSRLPFFSLFCATNDQCFLLLLGEFCWLRVQPPHLR